MSGDELKMVADHMGHSIQIHADIYKMQSSVLERTKVARALVAIQNGNFKLNNFKGQNLSSISVDEIPQPFDEEEAAESEKEDEDDSPEESFEDMDLPASIPAISNMDLPASKPSSSKGIKRKRWTVQEGASNGCFQGTGFKGEAKPNLLKQETQSLACLFRILFQMYSDEARKDAWPDVENKLCVSQFPGILPVFAIRQSQRYIIILLITRLLKMSDDRFRVHASHYYPLMCETMNYDLKHELCSILRKFFIHVGHKFGMIHPDRTT